MTRTAPSNNGSARPYPGRRRPVKSAVPASVTLAQAILESGRGAFHIGVADNHFGTEAFTVNGHVTWGAIAIGFVTVPTNEVVQGRTVSVQFTFCKYNWMADSLRLDGATL